MYINEVIRSVGREYPSEYDERDILVWCDEVSAMLAVESGVIYKEARLPVMSDNTVLLPTDVKAENIRGIYIGGRRIPLKDARTQLSRRRWDISRWLIYHEPEECAAQGYIKIVYEAPYEPIRQPRYEGTASIDPDKNTVNIYDCEFEVGDILNIKTGGVTAEHVNLIDIDYDASDTRRFVLTFGEGELDLIKQREAEVVITREITDRTVCGAPYDSMYKYYVLARIAQCQHDAAMYEQYMAEYNRLLTQYKLWLASRLPYKRARFAGVW